MNCLKFAGFCLLAAIVFGVMAKFVGGYPGEALALVVTGAGFWLLKPDHFKIGYAIWIVVTLASFAVMEWLVAKEARAEIAAGNPYAFLAGIEYNFQWFIACLLTNPICYWLGKRLARFLPRAENVSAVAEQFD